MPRIVVLGSINQDLAVTVSRLPRPGQTVHGTGLLTALGGKGANQAIAAARGGADVAMIGAVGPDDAGAAALRRLTGNGVDVARVRTTAAPTGTALITVDDAGENTVVVVAGANGELPGLEPADAALIASADLLLLQLELAMGIVLAGAQAAAAAGVPVMLNPSPVQPLATDLLDALTIMVLNEGEATELAPDLARVPRVVTTRGARGATYRGPDGTLDVPAPMVRVVDTTGAGDAFTGAFAAAWARGDSPLSAMALGCAAGAAATTRLGAG